MYNFSGIIVLYFNWTDNFSPYVGSEPMLHNHEMYGFIIGLLGALYKCLAV